MCTKFGTDMCDGRYCYDMKEKIFYDLRDLLLANAENAAILIEKPKYFFSYPNYLDNRHSLLVVRSDFILRACNTELESYCYENEVGLSSYGGKTLNKTLFHYNMCLYNYITNDHKTYTFQYETRGNEKISVLFLKLTDEQVEQLKKVAIDDSLISSHLNMQDYKGFYSKLKVFSHGVQSIYGEIGKEVREII